MVDENLTPQEEIKELMQALMILHYGLHPTTSTGALYADSQGVATQAFTTHCLNPTRDLHPHTEDEKEAIFFVQNTIAKYGAKYPEYMPDLGFMSAYSGHKAK